MLSYLYGSRINTILAPAAALVRFENINVAQAKF